MINQTSVTDLEYVMPEDTAVEAEQDGHNAIFQRLILEDEPRWVIQMCKLLIYEKHGRYFAICHCNGSRYKKKRNSGENLCSCVILQEQRPS